jgi:hypothetical protein
LRLLGWDRDRLEAGAGAEHGDVAVPLMGLLPPGFELLGPVRFDVLVGGEHPAGDRGLAEEPGGVPFGPDAQPDGLPGVLDG